MAGAYTLGTDVYAEYLRENADRAAGARGPVGAGPVTGARTVPGRTEEGLYGAGKGAGIGGASSGAVPWYCIAAGVVALVVLTRRG